MNTDTISGITYTKPTVVLLQHTGIGTAEIAARTCYDSFTSSEHQVIQQFHTELDGEDLASANRVASVNHLHHSDLLDKLAWTHFHHSILEHANLTYLIRGTSRGVLQEQSRHRIQAISVRSTRYTMQDILHAFNACSSSLEDTGRNNFYELISVMGMLVVTNDAELLEINQLFDKLRYQLLTIGRDEFTKLTMSKDALLVLKNRHTYNNEVDLFEALKTCKSKRNVGDNFKWIVTDNWKVDMVVTFNLRSLKNYFELRDSGAAYFQIKWLAQAMKGVTPSKYLDLIIKGN